MGDVPEEILTRLHPLEIKVLPHLKDTITIRDLAQAAGLQEVEATRAAQWLENKGALTISSTTDHELALGPNGKKAIEAGLPEQRFLAAIQGGASKRDAILKAGKLDPQEFGASIGVLKRAGLLEMKGDSFAAKPGTIGAETIAFLKKAEGVSLASLDKKAAALAKELQKRTGYLETRARKEHTITLTQLGKDLRKVDTSKLDFAERLTKEDLESGAWKDKTYRAYDVSVPVPQLFGGKEHFVQQAIEYIRRIWVEMGFEEMEGGMVQSAFWDLDALFVPQDHPARELQDTFYLETPASTTIEKVAFERVRDVHEHGNRTGSKGWQYSFSRAESEQLMLRTHTTVLSAQTLWKIREGKAKVPGKYYAVGSVFRNEKLDWSHLFEFHQVEGIVVDKSVTFAQLIGYLRIFFAKMGFPKIRVRPHHFPYTEPSVEVDVWNPRKEKWVELGGAGVFRPEVTKTLIGEEIPVLAWGLGLERIIVEYFDLQDLRDLYRNDIAQLQTMKRFIKIDEVRE